MPCAIFSPPLGHTKNLISQRRSTKVNEGQRKSKGGDREAKDRENNRKLRQIGRVQSNTYFKQVRSTSLTIRLEYRSLRTSSWVLTQVFLYQLSKTQEIK